MEIIFSVLAIASLIFFIFVIVDKVVFDRIVKDIKLGLTGKEVQALTKKQLKIVKVENDSYNALIFSRLTLFKYRLIFFKGKLISKQKE